jgi:putative transposase
MREYIRMDAPGGMFFLTLVTFDRRPLLDSPLALATLRAAFRAVRARRPFEIWAAAVLPDHLHVLIELPRGDADFSTRVAQVKGRFSRSLPLNVGESGSSTSPGPSRQRRRECTIWQRRFWEHTIRDDQDLDRHMDYIHYNAVKHGLATCPHAWTASSFERWVRVGRYPADWACACRRPAIIPPGLDLATSGE